MNLSDRLAINTSIFDGHDLKVSLKMIRSLDVKNVEFSFNQGVVEKISPDLFSTKNAHDLRGLLDIV